MSIRRIAEPILLGTLANILITLIFNPHKPRFDLTEFITAWLLAVPITEISRYINSKLERRYSWTNKPKLHFLFHFLYMVLSLIILLNVLGNAYLWIADLGFFSWSEVLIINLVTILVAMFLTIFNWAIDFYQRWTRAESTIKDSETEINQLKSKLKQSSGLIELQKGNTKFKVEASSIRVALHNFGFVRVYTENLEHGIFSGTLNELASNLPGHLFFQATRNTIVHRESIVSVAPDSYGKLQVKIKESYTKNSEFIVSRLKASSFRKWYNSTSK